MSVNFSAKRLSRKEPQHKFLLPHRKDIEKGIADMNRLNVHGLRARLEDQKSCANLSRGVASMAWLRQNPPETEILFVGDCYAGNVRSQVPKTEKASGQPLKRRRNKKHFRGVHSFRSLRTIVVVFPQSPLLIVQGTRLHCYRSPGMGSWEPPG